MVAQAEQALLVGEHDALGEQSLIFGAERVRFLPGEIFLPQFHLLHLFRVVWWRCRRQGLVQTAGARLQLFSNPPGVHIVATPLLLHLLSNHRVNARLVGDIVLPELLNVQHRSDDAALVDFTNGRDALVFSVRTDRLHVAQEVYIVVPDAVWLDVGAYFVQGEIVALGNLLSVVQQAKTMGTLVTGTLIETELLPVVGQGTLRLFNIVYI